MKTLGAWYANKNVQMQFGVPIIRREQKDHSNDCYFCYQDYTGYTATKKKKHIVYSNLQSAMRPVDHSKELPVPKPPNQEMLSSSSVDERSSDESVQLFDLESKDKPMPFSQKALNDLYRDLYLTNDKSELWHQGLKNATFLKKE